MVGEWWEKAAETRRVVVVVEAKRVANLMSLIAILYSDSSDRKSDSDAAAAMARLKISNEPTRLA
jgi:hypothetical protein